VRAAAAAALLLGTALRFAAAVRENELRDDERYRYLPIAASLRAGDGFAIRGEPTAQSMPLWPLCLAALPEGVKPQLLCASLSAACLPLAWLLARRLSGPRAALAVLAALAADLDHVALAGSVLTEPLFTLLVLLFALAWASDRLAPAALACGLATLARPEAFLFPLAIAAFTRSWRRPAVLLGGVLLAVAPWAYRNHRVFGAFVPFTTTSGVTLYAGMNPTEEELPFHEKGQARGKHWRAAIVMSQTRDEVTDDRELFRQALTYAWERPAPALAILGAKAKLLWTPLQRKGRSAVYAAAVLAAWWAILRGVRLRRPLVGPLLAVMTLVGLLFLAIPRYRAPYHPYLFLLAAAGLVREPAGADSVQAGERSRT
jgi:hypothetical protein